MAVLRVSGAKLSGHLEGSHLSFLSLISGEDFVSERGKMDAVRKCSRSRSQMSTPQQTEKICDTRNSLQISHDGILAHVSCSG